MSVRKQTSPAICTIPSQIHAPNSVGIQKKKNRARKKKSILNFQPSMIMKSRSFRPTTACPLNTLGTHSLRDTSLASHLHVSNGTLQRARQIDVEQRLVEPMDGRHPGRGALPPTTTTTVSLAVLQLVPDIAAARRAGGIMAVRDRVDLVAAAADDTAASRLLRPLAYQLLLVRVVLGGRRGAVHPADFRHAEDGLPALKGRHVALRGGESEAGGGEGSFGPAVVDAGEVPVYGVRGRVTVKLVADVDQMLHRGDVDVVDGGEVEDDGFEGGSVGFDGDGFAAARARVVPWAVLSCVLVNTMGKWDWREGAYAESGVEGGVGAAGFFENGGDHVVEVVVGVRIVETFREAVHEDTWVRRFDVDFGIGTIIVAYWEEKISSGFVRIVGAVLTAVVHQVVSNDRMDSHFAEEAALGFDHAE